MELELPRPTPDGLSIDASGTPGVYQLLSSDDLFTWNELATATNSLGAARFIDATPVAPTHRRFYRAARTFSSLIDRGNNSAGNAVWFYEATPLPSHNQSRTRLLVPL